MDKKEFFYILKYGHRPYTQNGVKRDDVQEVEVDEASLTDDIKEALKEYDKD